jgi:hypothetical protein
MKKLLTLTFVVTALLFSSKVNAQAYKKGDKLLNATLAVGNTYGFGFGASFESGITENISVGGSFDYIKYSYLGFNEGSLLYFGARGSYHAAEILKLTDDKFDPYVGLGLGYVSWPGSYSFGGSGIFFQGHLGVRYYFSEKLGGVAEVGAGASPLKIGVAFKF